MIGRCRARTVSRARSAGSRRPARRCRPGRRRRCRSLARTKALRKRTASRGSRPNGEARQTFAHRHVASTIYKARARRYARSWAGWNAWSTGCSYTLRRFARAKSYLGGMPKTLRHASFDSKPVCESSPPYMNPAARSEAGGIRRRTSRAFAVKRPRGCQAPRGSADRRGAGAPGRHSWRSPTTSCSKAPASGTWQARAPMAWARSKPQRRSQAARTGSPASRPTASVS